MDVNAVGASQSASNTSGTTQSSISSLADKDIFLKILAAEMSNQDPLNATDDSTQQIAQLAQFSGLEQQQEMNQSISQLIQNQKVQDEFYVTMIQNQEVTEGASLIGKTATFKDDKGTTYTDKVKSVKVVDGDVYVITDKASGKMSDVTEVGE